MMASLVFFLCQEGWLLLGFVLVILYDYSERDRCRGGAGRSRDLHEALGTAGLLNGKQYFSQQ